MLPIKGKNSVCLIIVSNRFFPPDDSVMERKSFGGNGAHADICPRTQTHILHTHTYGARRRKAQIQMVQNIQHNTHSLSHTHTQER